MTQRKYAIECNAVYLDGIVKDISRIRQWFQGFEAAGKSGPAHTEALRRAQVLLGSAQAIEAGTAKTRSGLVRSTKARSCKDAPKGDQ